MSTLDVPQTATAPEEISPDAAGSTGWLGLALQWVSRFGDRLNPILVKETRQALKSRQFGVTFTLLLAAGWLWSLFGVAIIGPGVFYSARGSELFVAYHAILAFPLLIVVPFSALRSMSVERDDGTYELMSITTLGPTQIVAGKLGSAALQIVVYGSAIAPFLAFTYLLRGIDFPTIFFVLGWLVLVSLGLSVIGLLVATGSRERHWQVVLSVVFVGGLLYLFAGSIALAAMLVDSALPFRELEFLQINLILLTAYGCAVSLAFLTAATQITFASDNRSTRIRIAVCVHQCLLAGWMVYALTSEGDWEFMAAWIFASAVHSYVTGVFFTAESPRLSPRVRRALPKSFAARALFSWFAPGPATGLCFSLANLSGTCFMALTASAAWHWLMPGRNSIWGAGDWTLLLEIALLTPCYVIIYLGLGLWLVGLLRRYVPVAPQLPMLVQLVLHLVFSALPATIHFSSPLLRNEDFGALQIFNPIWTLAVTADNGGIPAESGVWILLVPAAAIVVAVLNFPAAAAELRQGPVAAPPRVSQDEALLEAARRPAPPTRSSPWDEGPAPESS